MVEIRILTPADATEFKALRLQALQAHPEAFGEAAHEFEARTLDEISERMGDGKSSFVIGAFNPELCGTVGFFRQKGAKDEHKGLIWGVYVADSVRGQGIARKLMIDAIERARKIPGLEDLHLTCLAT